MINCFGVRTDVLFGVRFLKIRLATERIERFRLRDALRNPHALGERREVVGIREIRGSIEGGSIGRGERSLIRPRLFGWSSVGPD